MLDKSHGCELLQLHTAVVSIATDAEPACAEVHVQSDGQVLRLPVDVQQGRHG